MWAKSLYFEFIIIYLLSLVPWPNPSVIKLICSKDSSRLVRKLVQAKWTPILEKYKVKLPLECPLHPFRDVFGPQQEAKKRNRPTQWTCRLCGKSFFEEKFIDTHFENRHKNLVNKAEDAICFGDFCDIMRCEIFMSQENTFMNGDAYAITDLEVWHDASGYNSILAQANRAHVSALMHNKKKEAFFFWKDNPKEENSKDVLPQNKAFCPGKLRIDKKEKEQQVKEGGKLEKSSIFYNPDCEENSSQTFSGEQREHTENFLNMQRDRANCKPEELVKVKTKCEILIRTCITGLLLEMSDYAFKEMEDELNKAVCWYLSCDRYWEDGPLEPRAFPWGLILVLVVVLSLGICFCYYIIWILFDSEETIKNSQPIAHHSPIYIQRNMLERNPEDGHRITTSNIIGRDQSGRTQKFADDLVMSSDSNELTHSEHYIYVTYPPDLKRRLLEKYD